MNNIAKNLMSAVCTFAILAGTFAGGMWCGTHQTKAEAVEVTPEPATMDLILPTETEKRVVTKEEVELKLVEVQEFATYSGQYHVQKAVDQSRYLLDDFIIPGTTNTIDITCDGLVKVGYDIEEVTVSVDADSEKIYISLPAAKLLDNYVIWDSVDCKEQNKILNPIEFSQYQLLVSELEDMGLTQAENEGIYEKAEESMEKVILNFLGEFDEYEVVFM